MNTRLMERKKDLEKELKRTRNLLIRHYTPEAIILFGSLVHGKIKETSDIDLLVIKRTHKKFTERIGDVLRICKPKIAADFIVYTPQEFLGLQERGDFIKREIIEKGRMIYEK